MEVPPIKNKVHLIGKIANVTTDNCNEYSKFILCTSESFDKDGYICIQHDSFPITYFHKGKDAPIEGKDAKIEGKLRNTRYIDGKGQERRFLEVITSKVEIIEHYGE